MLPKIFKLKNMRGENQTADSNHLTNKCIQRDFKI